MCRRSILERDCCQLEQVVRSSGRVNFFVVVCVLSCCYCSSGPFKFTIGLLSEHCAFDKNKQF